MEDLVGKAKVLIEALPYMQRFVGKTIVIKYGGNAMTNEELRRSFAVDVVLLKHIGVRPVIVHGGGPQIATTLDRLGKESTFVGGLRVTDDETMEVVEMVLGGKVNREIVELVQQGGASAVGLTGSDGRSLAGAAQAATPAAGISAELARSCRVDPRVLVAVSESDFIPVVAPVGADEDGITYNVNADEAAGAIASALGAEKLMLLTDIDGVKGTPSGELISQLSREQAASTSRTVRFGRHDSQRSSAVSTRSRIRRRARTHIIDGRVVHAVLLEIFTDDAGVGTLLA